MIRDLVLLPGLLCDERLFAAQVHGLSDMARVHIPRLTANTVAGMAADVLAHAPETFALAGLSMGGYVAQEIMRQAPGRVAQLALLSTTARPDAPEQSKMRHDLIRLTQANRFQQVMPRLLPKLISSGRRSDRGLTADVVDMSNAVGPEIFICQQQAILTRTDSRPDLANITVPTAVICGDADELTPIDRHEEMQSQIEGATLTIISGSGHLVTMEAPQATTQALRSWLLMKG
jgi:pimeloyl-ACP methyl ester carboxylesterase